MKLRRFILAMLVAATLVGPAHAAGFDDDRETSLVGRVLELLGLDAGMQQSSAQPIVIVVPPPPPPPPIGPSDPSWWGSCQIDRPRPICHQN